MSVLGAFLAKRPFRGAPELLTAANALALPTSKPRVTRRGAKSYLVRPGTEPSEFVFERGGARRTVFVDAGSLDETLSKAFDEEDLSIQVVCTKHTFYRLELELKQVASPVQVEWAGTSSDVGTQLPWFVGRPFDPSDREVDVLRLPPPAGGLAVRPKTGTSGAAIGSFEKLLVLECVGYLWLFNEDPVWSDQLEVLGSGTVRLYSWHPKGCWKFKTINAVGEG